MSGQTSPLSALKAAGQIFTSVSSNMANANTVGFKQEVADVTTTRAGVVNTSSFSAGGVRARSLTLANEQGLLKATNSATDIAVSGNGFLIVGKNGEVPVNTSNDFSFTRAGSFLPDKQGYLQNTAGYYLQGWPTDTNGVPTATDLNSLSQVETIRVNAIAGITTPTTDMDLKLNLPSTAAIGATERTSMEMYDSLGEPHIIEFIWTKAADTPLTWNLDINAAGGTVEQNASGGGAYTGIPVVFNGSGQPVTFGGAAAPPNIFIDWANAALDSTVNLNLGAPNTSSGISCRYGGYSETLLDQNGKGVGQLTGIEINDEGIVAALFSNGESLTIYKLPLANFASPHRLSQSDGNIFGQTDLSGNYLLASAKSSGMGAIQSNSLELSTVEIANEFTRMMEVQRFYSANVKVIQTSEEMFADLKQLKR